MNRREPQHLKQLIERRKSEGNFRSLTAMPDHMIDFASNDFLGLAREKAIEEAANAMLSQCQPALNGATGSRLISGNYQFYHDVESYLAQIHQCEATLIFSTGYMANNGMLSSVPQPGDTILFDELCHTSIQEGIKLSRASGKSFAHNDLNQLEALLKESKKETYVVTESVFSMDGDNTPLAEIINLCEKYNAYLIVDEAHATGVFGWGKIQALNLTDRVFARIITFGKAIGTSGACIAGSQTLKEYLINFARPLIYTTGLPPYLLARTLAAYQFIQDHPERLTLLRERIQYFVQQTKALPMITSDSAIHAYLCSGNDVIVHLANHLQTASFFVKPIRYPTVVKGTERIRICLHTFNTTEEIDSLIQSIKAWQEEFSLQASARM
ncbi:MAG: 8-amino-7-oxononanoate synthase [Flavobacteriales bacterium]|nr:8-amino-7-oxononanoate synthase [Flavobacteriales bacterium]